MSEKKYLYKEFPIMVYHRGVAVFFGKFDDLVKKLKAKGLDDNFSEEREIAEKSLGITLCTNLGEPIIWLPKKPKSNGEFAYLTHEIFHATSFLLRGVGIEHTPDTEEVYAYTMEYLYSNILSWICS